jgi:ribose 5-phosphate isomerase B
MISIGERQIAEEMAIKIVDTWLNSSFEGGRHTKRIEMLELKR